MSKSKTGKGRKKNRDEKDSLAFKVLSADQTKELEECADAEAIQEKMLEILKTTDHDIDLKGGALLDYYVAGVWWAKDQQFTTEQISAMYTVIHTLLSNLQEKNMGLLENLKEFKKMLVGIGQEHSEISGGLECFNVDQAKVLSDYVHTSFFQHYKLFEFLTTHTQAEEVIGTDLDIQVPFAADTPWPPPLDEGVTEETFNEYIAPPPPPEELPAKTEEELEEERRLEKEERESREKEEESKVKDVLSHLSADEVKSIMNQVFDDMLTGLKSDVANKLRDRENTFINRINKVHKVAEK